MRRVLVSFILLVFISCLTQVYAQNFNFVNKMTSPDVSTDDQAGHSVAISGDYAIFGAYRNFDAGFESGSAYFVKKNTQTGAWEFMQQISPLDAAADDWFGWNVDISGTRAIIGLPKYDLGDNVTGAAYVFELFGTTWTQIAKLTASDEEVSDGFGIGVAISGDFAAVGAAGDDDFGSNTGATYVYRFNGSNWIEEAKITPSDPSDFSAFGGNVDISNDRLIIGASADDQNGNSAGAAYIFERNLGVWTEKIKLLAPDGAQYDDFGYDVAISGNYAVVGAPSKKKFSWNFVGAAYVFERVGGVWGASQKLLASDYSEDDQFGWSVGIDSTRIIIGANWKDGVSTNRSGAAYVFERNASWDETYKLTAPDADNSDYFGYSVAVSGEEAIVGAIGEESSGQLSGSVYFFGNSSVGLSDEFTSDVQIYPNPAENHLQIDLHSDIPIKYRITGTTGELKMDGELSDLQNYVNLDRLAAGIYFFEIEFENRSLTKTFVKQ